MKLLNCPVCEDQYTRKVFSIKEYHVIYCSRCKTRFIYPQPEDNVLDLIYTQDYFLNASTLEGRTEISRLKLQTAKLYLDLISRYITKPEGKSLFEVGCGFGDLLYEAKMRGFNISSLEVSVDAADHANKKLGGFYVRTNDDDITIQSIDVIVLADVIEHFRDPKERLNHYATFLKPSGIIFITTPILDTILAKTMGKYWFENKLEHLFYFSENSIKSILEGAGYSILTVEPNRKVLSLDYLISHFIRFKVPIITPLMIIIQKFLPRSILKYSFKIRTSSLNIIAKINS